MWTTCSPKTKAPRWRCLWCMAKQLERDVAVLLRRIFVAFAFEHFEGVDDFLASVARADHGVYIAAFGGDVGVGEAIAELLDFFGAHFVQGGLTGEPVGALFEGPVEFAAVDDGDRALGAHDGDFRGGP